MSRNINQRELDYIKQGHARMDREERVNKAGRVLEVIWLIAQIAVPVAVYWFFRSFVASLVVFAIMFGLGVVATMLQEYSEG